MNPKDSGSGHAGLDPRRVARFLRQRMEAGAPPVVLDTLNREAALGLVEAVAARPRLPKAPAPSHTTDAAVTDTAVTRGAVADETTADEAAIPALDTSAMDAAALRDAVLGCTRCRLSSTRTQAVFADGAPDARVMVVGEAPGAAEDRTGLPFVGPAGKFLDLMLASVGLSRRDSVYICNVIKCRPPANRDPLTDEIETCSPYLLRQIELVKPEVVLAVGTFSGRLLTGESDATLGALRGRVHRYRGLPLVVTYHPAALLRNRSWSRPTWDDLQLLRTVLDEG